MPLNTSWTTDDEIRRFALERDPGMEIVAQHRTWAVTRYGMQCLTDLYDIPAEDLRRDPGVGETWLDHLSRKLWTVDADVASCFADAIAYHGR